MNNKQKSRERRKRIVVNYAENSKEKEEWDLKFWQSLLTSIIEDIKKVNPKKLKE